MLKNWTKDNCGANDRDNDAAGDHINVVETIEFAKTWDLLNCNRATAPKGWLFPGFMAFVCFGPTPHQYTLTLQMGRYSSGQVVGRTQLCKQKNEQDNAKRLKDGQHCGIAKDQQTCDAQLSSPLTLKSKILAEMKHEKDMREWELKVVTILKPFDMSQKLLDTKMKLMEMEVDPEKRAALSKNVQEHLAKIEKLDEKLAAVMNDGNNSTTCSLMDL